MIETDEEGQRQVDKLVKNVACGAFNEWEVGFIKGLRGLKYSSLTKNQKAVVTRLDDWLRGEK